MALSFSVNMGSVTSHPRHHGLRHVKPQKGSIASYLPPELLRNVFMISVFASKEESLPSPVYALSQINRHWRATALDLPEIWTVLDITGNTDKAQLQESTSRSQPYPLVIRFKDTNSQMSELLSLVATALSRCQELHLDVPSPSSGQGVHYLLRHPAPLLERCCIIFHGNRAVPLETSHDSDVVFRGEAPKLRVLSLTNCYLLQSNYDFPSLKELTIQSQQEGSGAGFDELPQIYSDIGRSFAFSSLVRLILDDVAFDSDYFGIEHPFNLPRLVEFAASGSVFGLCKLVALLRLPADCDSSISLRFPKYEFEVLYLDTVDVAASIVKNLIQGRILNSAAIRWTDDSPSVEFISQELGFRTRTAFKFDLPAAKDTTCLQHLLSHKSRDHVHPTIIETLQQIDDLGLQTEALFFVILWPVLADLCKEEYAAIHLLELTYSSTCLAPIYLENVLVSFPNLETFTRGAWPIWGPDPDPGN
ncbi:hypothetical protein MD484_g9070, partial [Candolleomyces efflorescens]